MRQQIVKEKNVGKWALGLALLFLGFIAIGKVISAIQLPVVNEGLSLPQNSILATIFIFAAVNVVILSLISLKKIKDQIVPVLMAAFVGLVLAIMLVGELTIPN